MSNLRKSLGAALLAGLTILSVLPASATANPTGTRATAWEFFEARAREYSVTRKPKPTVAVEFAGQRINDNANWSELSEAERAAVLAAQTRAADKTADQAAQQTAAQEPPYPRLGLKPLMDRLHRVRGPVNQPLRLHLGIDALGKVDAIGTDVPVSEQFLNDLLQTLVNSGYKPARCGDKNCAGQLTLDIVYLGS